MSSVSRSLIGTPRELAASTSQQHLRTREVGRSKGARRLAKIHVVDHFAAARWYSVRPASNCQPATYRCPFGGGLLPALLEHMLVIPEDDPTRRRHAHNACVARARKDGHLPLKKDGRPPSRGLVARLLRRC